MSTKIEWTNETWNPVTGCSKVSQGCKHCYAERLWPKVSAAEAKRTGQPARAFTDIRCHPERLDHPLSWRKPKRIFVNSMSDLFHEDVPFSFIDEVWGTMIEAPQHQFQILTKRPERMREYLSRYIWSSDARITAWPLPNVWLGVSVEEQATADERILELVRTSSAVRFISAEPLLGQIWLYDWMRKFQPHGCKVSGTGYCRRCESTPEEGHCDQPVGQHIDWVIAGGESGPGARPAHPDWIRSLRDQCAMGGIPFFFKQWGEYSPAGTGNPWRYIKPTDRTSEQGLWSSEAEGVTPVWRVGKKKAGRLLDGRTHDDYPA